MRPIKIGFEIVMMGFAALNPSYKWFSRRLTASL